MKKFLFLFLSLFLYTSAFAAGSQTLVDNNGRALGTASNPLYVTGGGSSAATYTVCASNKTASYKCDYTADGTNDEVQIQAAIDAATALPYGGKVLLSEGSFNIYASIAPKSNVWLQGSGISHTVLFGQSDLSDTAIIQGLTFSTGSPLVGFQLTDMTLDGTSMSRTGYSAYRKGVYIQYLSRAVFRNLRIYNTPATCLGADFFYDGLVEGNIVDTCGTAGQAYNVGSNGIGIGTIGSASFNDEPLIITNNIAKNIANKAIMLEAQDGASSPRHVIISNNIAYNSKDGFSIAGTLYVNFVGNQSFGNSQDGLWVDGSSRTGTSNLAWVSLIISNNNFYDNDGDGVEIKGEESSHLIFTGNIIHTSGGVGLKIKPQHSLIDGNIITASGLDGIWMNIGVAGKDIKITNNIIKNNGSLGTAGSNNGIKINVTTVAWDYLEISNNTIIDTAGSPTQAYGLLMDLVTGGTLTNVLIKNNQVRGNASGPFNNVDVPEGNIIWFGNQHSGTSPQNELVGNEGLDSSIVLSSDDGDDTADSWTLKSVATGNNLDISNGSTLMASFESSGGFQVDAPAAQTIAAGNVITDDACGTLKLITSAGAVTTNTTNTFTAPAAGNEGCIMHVCNTGSNNITLDNNANFKSAAAGDVVLTQDDCVTVGSTGAGGVWYQLTGLEAN